MHDSLFLNIVIYIVALFAIAFFAYQVYEGQQSGYLTELVYEAKVEDSVAVNGFFVRSEAVIRDERAKGVIGYSVDSGGKVAVGQEVASIYSDGSVLEICARMDKLREKLDNLEAIFNDSALTLHDSSGVEKKIQQRIEELSEGINDGNLECMADVKTELERLFNLRQLISGEAENFDSRRRALESELQQLQKKLDSMEEPVPVYSKSSGYFVHMADGWEGTLSFDDIDGMTEELARSVIGANITNGIPDGVVGKLLSDYEWYYVCFMPKSRFSAKYVGKKLNIRFAYDSEATVKATVYSVKDASDGNLLVTFHGTVCDTPLFQLRKQTADIILDEITGLQVAKSAVRMKSGGKLGVYVIDGSEVRFRTFGKYFEYGDYLIIDPDDEQNTVKLYDRVILRGKELEEGKSVY